MSSTPDRSSSASERPTTASRKSFRQRMGTVVRRTSSTFSITGRASPTPSQGKTPSRQSSDAGSLNQLDTTAHPPSPAEEHAAPSPIAESPARENEEGPPAPIGPSPLAQAATTAEEVGHAQEASKLEQAPTQDQAPSQDQTPTHEQTSTHEPIIAEDAHPVQFTDEPEEMSRRSRATSVDHPHAPVETRQPAEPLSPGVEGGSSYFEMPKAQVVVPPSPVSGFREALVVTHDEDPTSSQTTPRPIVASSGPVTMPVPEPIVQTQSASTFGTSDKPTGSEREVQAMHANPWNVSGKPSKGSLASSARDVRGSQPPAPPGLTNGDVSYPPSRASRAYDDTFADPPSHGLVPGPDPFALSDPVVMPEAKPLGGISTQVTPPTPDAKSPAVVQPVVDMRNVFSSNAPRKQPSRDTFADQRTSGTAQRDEPALDERQPLLGPESTYTDNPIPSYLQQSTSTRPPPAVARASLPVSTHVLHSLGWIEYVLPDSSFYFVHPTMRVTTDIDLRTPHKLDAVTAYFEGKDGTRRELPPRDWELWLRDGGSKPNDFRPVRCWISHQNRVVTFDHPLSTDAPKKGRAAPDDRMDSEFRYWSFLEAHPAHVSLPRNAKAEAMDALAWSYSDRLLPGARRVPPPFSQEECQELMGILRSTEDASSSVGIQTVVQTRIVSRVLIRMAQWRQMHFRPEKALPRDAHKDALGRSRRLVPVRRLVADAIVSIACLGIPYMFMGRANHRAIDAESGLPSPGPILMIGACACLIAAIVLSASVTLISLPGLDSVARVAGFVAILFSSASMVSALISLLRYKTMTERPHLGEGLVSLSRKNFVMSLPLVFLAYAIIAFVTGIVVYSFKGVTLTNVGTTSDEFAGYTKWTVVGAAAGLAVVLLTCVLLNDRR